MAINNGRNLSGYTADSVANYNDAYKHQRSLGYSDADAHLTASGLLQPAPATTSSASTTTPAFSNQEVYNIQSQGYYNQGNKNLGDAYSALWDGSNSYATTARGINNFYNALANDITAREGGLANAKYSLAKELQDDIMSTKNYVNQMFGPNGELTKEINQYYDDLGNYLSTDAGRQAAAIAAQGVHSGASLGAIRAQQNAAYNESFSRYVQAKEQEINAKQQIAANLINYMSTLRQEYGDTTNQYIIQQYQRANDLLNGLSSNIASSNIELLNAKRLASGGGGKSTSQQGGDPVEGEIRYDSNGIAHKYTNGKWVPVNSEGETSYLEIGNRGDNASNSVGDIYTIYNNYRNSQNKSGFFNNVPQLSDTTGIGTIQNSLIKKGYNPVEVGQFVTDWRRYNP